MPSVIPTSVPPDYSQWIKRTRQVAGLTQAELAKRIGVSYASVNRWENGQSRPNNLAWQRIIGLELSSQPDDGEELHPGSPGWCVERSGFFGGPGGRFGLSRGS